VSNGYDSKITFNELERTGEEAVTGYFKVPSHNLAAGTITIVLTLFIPYILTLYL
jgi:hypothetical protein